MFLTMEDGFGIRFEKMQWGQSENALFIHGNLASCEWWLPTFEALQSGNEILAGEAARGTLLCSDWRGYGRSTGLKDRHEINFDRFADDYIQLIEQNELREVHAVGHSTGGLIAIKAILKRPELFKSLVLLDSVGAKGLELVIPLEQVLAHFEHMSVNKDYFSQVLATTIKGIDASSRPFQDIVDVTWGCDRISWVGVPEILSTRIDIEGRMKEVKLPTLILHGEEDLVLPTAVSEKLHRQLPHSELRILKGVGHSYNMEQPRAFAETLIEFWSSISASKLRAVEAAIVGA